ARPDQERSMLRSVAFPAALASAGLLFAGSATRAQQEVHMTSGSIDPLIVNGWPLPPLTPASLEEEAVTSAEFIRLYAESEFQPQQWFPVDVATPGAWGLGVPGGVMPDGAV